METVKVQFRIIVRPFFPKVNDILLEGKVNTTEIPLDTLAAIVFDIERIVNEHLPQMRVHSNIDAREPADGNRS